MKNNIEFFRRNVDFYSEEYRDYSLKPWERKIVDMVTGPEVLDVACGGGRMAIPLLNKGYNVTGTDFVGEFGEKIKRHKFEGKFTFVQTGMIDLPFPNEVFDFVICINSLVYLRSVKEVFQSLSEMSRVVKPLGMVYITTWNLWHPYWGTSVILNYIIGRGRVFGETSPFLTTDRRLKNSRTFMFVPTIKVLKRICSNVGLNSTIYTGSEFMGSKGLLVKFHPNLVIVGEKEAV